MKKAYRLRDQSVPLPSDVEIARYRDFGRLVYNYQHMTRPLYKRPLYKDPKAFLVILIIVLLAIILAEVEHRKAPAPWPPQREAPGPR